MTLYHLLDKKDINGLAVINIYMYQIISCDQKNGGGNNGSFSFL